MSDTISQPTHPHQPLKESPDGGFEFHKNSIVCYLLGHSGLTLKEIAHRKNIGVFNDDDFRQLVQLIGFPVAVYTNFVNCTPEERETLENEMLRVYEAMLKSN